MHEIMTVCNYQNGILKIVQLSERHSENCTIIRMAFWKLYNYQNAILKIVQLSECHSDNWTMIRTKNAVLIIAYIDLLGGLPHHGRFNDGSNCTTRRWCSAYSWCRGRARAIGTLTTRWHRGQSLLPPTSLTSTSMRHQGSNCMSPSSVPGRCLNHRKSSSPPSNLSNIASGLTPPELSVASIPVAPEVHFLRKSLLRVISTSSVRKVDHEGLVSIHSKLIQWRRQWLARRRPHGSSNDIVSGLWRWLVSLSRCQEHLRCPSDSLASPSFSSARKGSVLSSSATLASHQSDHAPWWCQVWTGWRLSRSDVLSQRILHHGNGRVVACLHHG